MDWEKKYVNAEKLADRDKKVVAMQAGGQIPPEGQQVPANAGAQQGPSLEEMVTQYMQVKQQDPNAAAQMAVEVMDMLAQQLQGAAGAAGATAAMYDGGKMPTPYVFNADGTVSK